MKEKNINLDICRAIGTIAVVFYHCGDSGKSGILPFQIIEIFLNWCVPIFVFITGALFLGDVKRGSAEEMVRKRIPFFLSVIIIWGFIYNVLSMTLIEGLSAANILKAIMMVVKADTTYCFQFWYLYLLIGLYMLIPILKPWSAIHLGKKQIDNEAAIILSVALLVSIIIPTGLRIAGANGENFWKGAFTPFSAYLFYLLSGCALSRFRLPKIVERVLLITLVGQSGYFAVQLGMGGYSNLQGWYGYSSFFTWNCTALLFHAVMHVDYSQINRGLKKAVKLIADESLGIYILHVIVLMALRKVGFAYENFNPWIYPICSIFATTIICCFASKCLKRVPILRGII